MTFADVKNRVYFLTSTSSTSFTDANLTLAIGRALERVVALINGSDSKWQWDDTNQSDLPIATAALVSGQQDYSLATTHQTIDRIEVKPPSGQWTRLKPIDQQLLKRDRNVALSDYQTGGGTPNEYDILGSSVFLYPAPNYSQSASLKIYFTRAPLTFSYVTGLLSDGTGSTSSSPGFNSLFHDLVPLWASYDYGLANGKNNTNQIFASITQKERELVDFYGRRDRDARPRLTISTDSNK